MVNLDKIISGLSQSGAAAGLAGGLAGGTLVGAFGSKKGRKTMKKVAKVGGLALVGGLAYKAYRDYQDGQQRTAGGHDASVGRTPATALGPQAPGTAAAVAAERPWPAADDRWSKVSARDFEAVVAEPPVGESRSLLIVRAMIAAAMSDGHLDSAEQGTLFREIDRLDLSPEEKGMMLDELRRPWPVHAIVARCREPETAIEVYTASLLAIDESRPEGANYLGELARLLQLPSNLVGEIHAATLAQQTPRLAEPA
jgi:uncharacterized membrane protein YebE (DUF533 family)